LLRPRHRAVGLPRPLHDAADRVSRYWRAIRHRRHNHATAMQHDEIRRHIESAGRQGSEARLVAARVLHACWPGGFDDRTEPAALGWIRRWHPAKAGATVPVCSCASGRCAVCN